MTAWSQLAHPDALPSPQDLAVAARRAAGCPDGRLPLAEVCKAAMVRVLRHQLVIGERRRPAMLVPTAAGFHALVDTNVWQKAERSQAARRWLSLVVAHELGHTFFYQPGSPPTRSAPADRTEEDFCHRFAVSLLVPPAAARQATVDPDGLRELADRYDVSWRSAALAIAAATPGITVLSLGMAPHPTKKERTTMRVEWAAAERYIAQHESFKSSLAGLEPDENGSSTELLELAGRREWVTIYAWHLKPGGSMIAVVRPATSRPLRQLQLF